MKVIDEKGRLFGKLNIIDLIAIIVIIAVVAFAGFKLLGGSKPNAAPSAGSPGHITYVVQVNGVAPQTYEGLKTCMAVTDNHDQLMASGELVGAFVTNIEAVPHVNYINTEDGKLSVSEDSGPNGRLDLYVTIEANVPDTITNLVGAQEVRVGKAHIVKTVHMELPSGVVVSCDWS